MLFGPMHPTLTAYYAVQAATSVSVQDYANGQPFCTAVASTNFYAWCASSGATAYAHNGLPYNSDGRLCVSFNGDPVYYDQGLPFASNGFICVDNVNSPSYRNNGFPFASNNRLCVRP